MLARETSTHWPDGARLLRAVLDREAQAALLADIGAVLAEAPLYRPAMPRTGRPFSVEMSNCGSLGWVSDRVGGYRYQTTHPFTGRPWPPMPTCLLQLWACHAGHPAPPEACLINVYDGAARLGSHVDRDEQDLTAPVLSISLGDDAVFHVGGPRRADAKHRELLRSGDIVVLGGAARLAHHGIDRVIAGSSALIPGGGRINLTLRRVTREGSGSDGPA